METELNREQFLAVYNAARLLSESPDDIQFQKVGFNHDVEVNLPHLLWNLFKSHGSFERLYDSKI